MSRSPRRQDFVVASVGLLAIAVLGARPFVDSWTRALVYGVACFGLLQVIGHWDRVRAARQLERQYGTVTVRGPTLIVDKPGQKAESVHAADMRELRYAYSPYGWSGANSWELVYVDEGERKQVSIFESTDHFLDPVRAWCTSHLAGFDRATFDRLAGSVGSDDEKDVLVWSRRATQGPRGTGKRAR